MGEMPTPTAEEAEWIEKIVAPLRGGTNANKLRWAHFIIHELVDKRAPGMVKGGFVNSQEFVQLCHDNGHLLQGGGDRLERIIAGEIEE